MSSIKNKMLISGNNLAINNTSAAYALDVNGNIRAINNWVRTINSQGFYNDTYTGGFYMADTTWVRTWPDAGSIGIWAGGGNICATGRFGAGTSTPSYAIHCNGNAGMSTSWLYPDQVGGGMIWGNTYTHVYDDGDLHIYTDDNLYCTNNYHGTQLYIYYNNVAVGSGTAPSYPLHIYNTVTTNYTGYGLLNTGSAGGYYGNNSGNVTVGMYSTARMACPEFNATSDIRIKRDITQLDKQTSLDKIRLLKPKSFTYKDTITHSDKPTVGFIAQEVEIILPYTVTQEAQHIPNIYELGTIQNDNTISITSTKDLNPNDNIKIIANSSTEEEAIIDTIINDTTFTIKEPIHKPDENTHGNIFVYGHKVDDFRVLHYDALFTIGISALQQLNNDVDDTLKLLETMIPLTV
jgi:hypothetical protein